MRIQSMWFRWLMLVLMGCFVFSSATSGTKREYTGSKTSYYQREALIKLNDFYTHILEAASNRM